MGRRVPRASLPPVPALHTHRSTGAAPAQGVAEPGGLDDDGLSARFEELRAEHFPASRIQFRIEWSGRMRIAGMCYPDRRLIRLSRAYHAHFPGEIELTLKHELIHAVGIDGHGARFRQEAGRLGCPVHGRVYPGLHRPYRYEYVCPNGHVHRARRRLGDCSCGRCARRFDPRYRLRLVMGGRNP